MGEVQDMEPEAGTAEICRGRAWGQEGTGEKRLTRAKEGNISLFMCWIVKFKIKKYTLRRVQMGKSF